MAVPSGFMSVPEITGVSEVVLSVADLPSMREFYSCVLGFAVHSEISMETEAPDPDGDPTISFLTISQNDSPLTRNGHPQFLVLIDYKRHVFAKRRLVGHDVTRSTLNHLAFEIPGDSYGAHKLNLDRAGLEVTEAEFPTFGAQALFFETRKGTRWNSFAPQVLRRNFTAAIAQLSSNACVAIDLERR